MREKPVRECVQRLRRLDCCAVSDALDSLRLPGAVLGLPQRSGSGRIAGYVVTVKLGTGERPAGPPTHLGCTAIEQSGPDDVIVVEQRSGMEAACWGGLLSLGAKVRGVAGVVADGPVRDIDEAIAYELPVFSRALLPLTARGWINAPTLIGDVTISAGDLVLGDSDGVVAIPRLQAAAALDAAAKREAQERQILERLQAGESSLEIYGWGSPPASG